MNLLPSEVSLQMRFDAFCKKVITYTNYKLLREGQKRREQGYVFSDFEEGELEQYYYTYDTYPDMLLIPRTISHRMPILAHHMRFVSFYFVFANFFQTF